MKLEYLQTAALGLKWMRSYYQKNPQLDRTAALGALKRGEDVLMSFPHTGGKYEEFDNVREYHIHGTAFSLLYTALLRGSQLI